MSPTKVRRVVDLVRGLPVQEALTTLQFAPQAASEPVYKVVASAVANAESTESLRADDLYISQAFVDEGVTMRRIRPRAKGSASRILKRSSHITVVVEPREAAPERPTRRRRTTTTETTSTTNLAAASEGAAASESESAAEQEA